MTFQSRQLSSSQVRSTEFKVTEVLSPAANGFNPLPVSTCVKPRPRRRRLTRAAAAPQTASHHGRASDLTLRPPRPSLVSQGLKRPVFCSLWAGILILRLRRKPQLSRRQVPVPGTFHAFFPALHRAQWKHREKAARNEVLPWGRRCPVEKEVFQSLQ